MSDIGSGDVPRSLGKVEDFFGNGLYVPYKLEMRYITDLPGPGLDYLTLALADLFLRKMRSVRVPRKTSRDVDSAPGATTSRMKRIKLRT